jgi:hypothetical protein
MEKDLLRNNYLQLGIAAFASGDLHRAAKFFEAGIEECDRLGLRDLGMAALLYNLVVVSERLGRVSEMELSLLRCLQLCRQFGGKEHPALPLIARLLSHFYLKKGNRVSARYHQRQVLKNPELPLLEQLDHLFKLEIVARPDSRQEKIQFIGEHAYAMRIERVSHAFAPGQAAIVLCS